METTTISISQSSQKEQFFGEIMKAPVNLTTCKHCGYVGMESEFDCYPAYFDAYGEYGKYIGDYCKNVLACKARFESNALDALAARQSEVSR